MGKNDEVYIGSVSPTIGVVEQRQLAEVARNANFLLTTEEFTSIMAIYGKALDRVFRENGLVEE